MSSFAFKDYNSSEDLIIQKPVLRPSWAQEMTELSTGSTAKVIQFSRTYGNSPLEISAVIRDTSPDSIDRLYSKLRGFGQLVLSSDPEKFMYAVASVLQPQAVSQHMAELDVYFTLLPFAYAVESVTSAFGSRYAEIINNGSVFAAPEIRFTAQSEGDVTLDVNGEKFIVKVPAELANREIIIDCDIQKAYYMDGDSKENITHRTYNDFPLLHTGSNYVKYTGSISESSISVRERWY